MFIRKKGQTIQEYVILLALVATAFIAMQAYMKRGVQGRLRDLANQISSKQYEPNDTTSQTGIKRSGSSTEKEHLGTYTNQGSDTTKTNYESTTVEE
jgi:Flp pilus assembly pilin Flp